MDRQGFWHVLEILRLKTNEEEGLSIKELIDELEKQYGEKKEIIKLNDCIDPNINLLDNLRHLHKAILEQYSVRFKYGRYNEKKQFALNNKDYHVIPKKIMYQQNRYYLIGLDLNAEKKQKYYRLDRMMQIEKEQDHDDHTNINLEKFDIRTFDMFTSDTTEIVTLRVHKKLMDMMIERFGLNISIRADFEHPDYVIIHQEMGRSQGLIRWLLNQGSMIEVLEPASLREEIKMEVKKMLSYYED